MRRFRHKRLAFANAALVGGDGKLTPTHRALQDQSEFADVSAAFVERLPPHSQGSALEDERLGLSVSGAGPRTESAPDDGWLALFLGRPLTRDGRQERERQQKDFRL